MDKFERLFGAKESDIKETCILLPLIQHNTARAFGVNRISRGKLYGTGSGRSFSLIHAGMGAPFLGDAVLYLDKTRCRNIILFGSCGLIYNSSGLDIGSLVLPKLCYSLDSFTQFLLKPHKALMSFRPDNGLMKTFLENNRDIKIVDCATLGSLKLEEKYADNLKKKGICAVDMECAAFFAASKYIKRRALALFYVTDIIGRKPFYEELDDKDGLALEGAIKKAAHILCNFIEKNLTS